MKPLTVRTLLTLSSLVIYAACSPAPEQDVPNAEDSTLLAAAAQCADAVALLVPDTGTFSRAIDTPSPEAQAFFDQGLRLSYSYYFPEAIGSFDAALCYDPDNPMIHWGRALAIAPNPNSRYGASPDDPQGEGNRTIALAAANATQAAAVERGLIDTLAVLFDNATYPDQTARTQAFIEAAQALYAQYPDDHEVAFLLADGIMMASPWNYFVMGDGSPLPNMELAMQVMEKGMSENPQHPGLTHLHIHLMEASRQPNSAEPSADRLESLTPMAGHMVHMPGHIYMRLGRYEDAITSNERSIAADEYFVRQWGERPLPSVGTYFLSATNHAGHARMFIHWAGVLQGNFERAMSIASPMAMMATPEALDRGASLRAPAIEWMTLKAFGRWNDILAITTPPASRPFLQGILNLARGSAHLAAGDVASAEIELGALRAVSENPVLQTQRASVNTASDLLAIAVHALAGEIASAKGETETAISEFQQAVALQDKLRYMEPPDWIQSMRLFLGQAYINAGQFADAEATFREDLVLLEDNGWALFGLASALEAQGDAAGAAEVRARFDKAWENADVTLTGAHF